MNKAIVGYDDGDWYEVLVEECKAIITEAVFNSRWSLVDGYHRLGERIVTEQNFDRDEIYGKKIVSGLAESLGKSERTIWRAMQFYEKYPSLDTLPGGKNISWNKIITQYLPEKSKEQEVLPEWVHRWESMKSLAQMIADDREAPEKIRQVARLVADYPD
ncbi:hypothetical protein KA005_16585 [bacterium]|nr:hypothetical protein [bacterium]